MANYEGDVICVQCGKSRHIHAGNTLKWYATRFPKCKSCATKTETVDTLGRKRAWRTYRNNARTRNLPFKITYDEFLRLIELPCHYCGQVGGNILQASLGRSGDEYYEYTGLDRADNTFGYVQGNVIPCCCTCNRAKNRMPESDFMVWLDHLVGFRLA